ncbi:MAG TPA: metallophosphoesterase [Chloroflexota bacterium]
MATGAAFLAAAALAADSLWLEPHRLQRRCYTVPLNGLPLDLDGLTILHLSDFHYVPRDAWLSTRLAELAAETAANPPDLIAFTGDLVEWDEDAPAIAALLGAMTARLGSFAVLGNHDYGNAVDPHDPERHSLMNAFSELVGVPLQRYRERLPKPAGNCIVPIIAALEHEHVTLLRNTAVRLSVGATPLWIGGVDEPHQHRANPALVFAAIPAHDLVLLLAHSPEVLECSFPRSPDLILAGHTHGGQVRLPWLSPLVTHTRVPLPAYQGLIATQHGPMHISPGIGASIPLRFRCPPEVTTLVLRAEREPPRDN